MFKSLFTRVSYFSVLASFFYCATTYAFINKDADPQNCTSCHQSAVSSWMKSDHAKAMDVATKKTVLGDFNNAKATHYSQKARFYTEKNNFFMEMNHENKTSVYKIKYTFGHYPLQQYLIETQNGKYQVLPFSWDSRTKAEGGQRWFVMYEDEDIKAQDRLHWQQPLQSWNGMCADCHSDGLKRNYDKDKGTFDTTFDNINVGCQSCHGKMNNHTKDKNAIIKNSRNQPKIINNWLRKVGERTASWQGEKRDNSFMDTCFACHSLRSPLTNGIKPEHAFLDQFSPSFIIPPLYHADGQIKEEVYVYGSFLQSKMYKAGVNCIDCHDQHTMKIKVPDNGLCLQCHSAEVFNQPTHFKHEEGSEGSKCVNCHMPTNRYMGVDDRRDHSFKIPRPHLSTANDTPNACTNCHEDKDNNWAAAKLEQWHGKPKALSKTYTDFLRLQSGKRLQLAQHLAIVNDKNLNDIVRATALTGLVNTTPQLSNEQIKPWVASDKPLIRLAIAQTGQLVPPNERHLAFATLLSDKYKSVRIAAANQLIGNTQVNAEVMKKAFDELMLSNDINTWRGEGNLNESMIHYGSGNRDKAIAALKNAINVDPYFSVPYLNLADIYKTMGDSVNEAKIYQQALKTSPLDGMVHYSYGLYLIRNKDTVNAIESFKQAIKLDPTNAQYIYLYALAQDSVGKTKQALMQLRMMITKVDNPQQLAQLGLSFSQKLRDQKSYQFFGRFMQQ
ncbi:multiheme c-type cytochrome [Pseudocolwellia agarivorans]|uniref:multiheme c-type cytochrome n=1 Tax=Pseudocolwellia agarivorans TaxID=1911682 RepID=UPI000987C688|nr:multiheme c-type cytochrome [Pseudocolwellia agarivorans]